MDAHGAEPLSWELHRAGAPAGEAAPGGLAGFAGAHPRRGCCWSSAGFRGPLGDTAFAPWIKLSGLGIRLDEVIPRPQ